MTKLAVEAATVQFPLVDHAAAAGWERVSEADALRKRRGEGGLFFYDELEAALLRLNPGVVTPTDVSVLAATTTPSITLTTCNPRFSAAQRLVVRGVLTSSQLSGAPLHYVSGSATTHHQSAELTVRGDGHLQDPAFDQDPSHLGDRRQGDAVGAGHPGQILHPPGGLPQRTGLRAAGTWGAGGCGRPPERGREDIHVLYEG